MLHEYRDKGTPHLITDVLRNGYDTGSYLNKIARLPLIVPAINIDRFRDNIPSKNFLFIFPF
jgi:hypothetical protein